MSPRADEMNDPASVYGHRPARPRRTAGDLKNLPRSAALSHLYRSAEAVAPPQHPPVSMFSGVALWEWIRHYLAYVFRSKHAFPSHTASPQHAIYEFQSGDAAEEILIALAGDWGTGTDEAEAVAQRMREF